MNNLNNDIEEVVLKNRILSQNNTFKTAFTATLGFYAAQLLATVLGLAVIGSVVFIGYEFLK